MNTMIRYYDLNDPDNSGTTIHLDNAFAIVDIDYDPQDAYIYYTDRNNRRISRVRINGTGMYVYNMLGICIFWVR